MFKTYEDIKRWRTEMFPSVMEDHFQLNAFHDQLIHHTFHLAKEKIEKEQGPAPAPFAFFLMGSAGRFEQSIWSDQDHGLLYNGEEKNQAYFLTLGEEVEKGLAVVGYERCEGNVMASNPLWCQPVDMFSRQAVAWLKEKEWHSLRNFLIFFDSRVIVGHTELLDQVKCRAFKMLDENPKVLTRLIDNVDYVKKGVGVFGQLLPNYSGEKKGRFDLKQTIYFPYVNAMRILALVHQFTSSSTLSRFQSLRTHYPDLSFYEKSFMQFLNQRLTLKKGTHLYREVHTLTVEHLTKEEKQQLKRHVRTSQRLYQMTKSILKEAST